MHRDDHICIQHILDAAHKTMDFTRDRTRQDLNNDELLSLSLVHLLEIIGEAANGVTRDFREKHPHIPWRNMVNLRNRLIHGYFNINLDIVWDTIKEDIPPLVEELEKIAQKDE